MSVPLLAMYDAACRQYSREASQEAAGPGIVYDDGGRRYTQRRQHCRLHLHTKHKHCEGHSSRRAGCRPSLPCKDHTTCTHGLHGLRQSTLSGQLKWQLVIASRSLRTSLGYLGSRV